MYKSVCAAVLVTGLTATMSGIPAAPAAAKPLEREHFHDTTSEVVDGFCGEFTVRVDTEVRGSVLVNARGRDRLAYYSSQVHGSFSYTNLANDQSLTEVFNINDKDLKVTDNGDGTLTVLVLATGSFKVYGPDGRLLFQDPGQVRYEILVDHAGTPTDPTDDEVVEFLGIVKGSTGRNDTEGRDFCADIHEFIG